MLGIFGHCSRISVEQGQVWAEAANRPVHCKIHAPTIDSMCQIFSYFVDISKCKSRGPVSPVAHNSLFGDIIIFTESAHWADSV